MNRPPEFDRRLADHMPLLRKYANRYAAHPQERDDLIQDTFMYALGNWEKFRPEGSFHKWLIFMIRWIATEKRRKAQRRANHLRPIDGEAVLENLSTPADQFERLDALEIIQSIPTGRDGDILRRRAMGDTLAAIASDYGIGKERARQIEVEQREVLRNHLDRGDNLIARAA